METGAGLQANKYLLYIEEIEFIYPAILAQSQKHAQLSG